VVGFAAGWKCYRMIGFDCGSFPLHDGKRPIPAAQGARSPRTWPHGLPAIDSRPRTRPGAATREAGPGGRHGEDRASAGPRGQGQDPLKPRISLHFR
jgi:hypothetical protein